MSSKNNILNRIKNIQQEKTDLPENPNFTVSENIISAFITSLEANHTEVISVYSIKNIGTTLEPLLKNYKNIIAIDPAIYHSTVDISSFMNKMEMNDVEAFIVKGEIGVGENGAIWIPEENMILRALPFITLHLFVVIQRENIVGNMHQGYSKISHLPKFGVFVAGPSKTADIEQSLVVGAHGPKKMTVIITD